MKTTQQPITETLETIRSVNQDIKAIKARLFKGIKDDQQVLINYRILMEAMAIRDQTVKQIDELFKAISLEDLGLEIN